MNDLMCDSSLEWLYTYLCMIGFGFGAGVSVTVWAYRATQQK